MSDLTYDESRWPLVIATSPPEPIDEEQITLLYKRVDQWLARKTDVGIVMDPSQCTSFGPGARNQITLEVAKRPTFYKYVIMGVVMKSTFQRGAVTALHWLVPPKHPWGAFSDRAAAEKWVSQKLAERQTERLRSHAAAASP
jgi:hypothetical protein